MSLITVIAFCVGVALGGIACALGAQRGWRCVRRETAEQMRRSMEIQDQFYATTAMCYLSALQNLESGDLESAKGELAFGAATFYHQFSGAVELSDWIRT